MRKMKPTLTLHDYIITAQPEADVIDEIKSSALQRFRAKVVWDKRTERLSKMFPDTAFVYDSKNGVFDVDVDIAKEMAYTLSVDLGGGKRFFLGF